MRPLLTFLKGPGLIIPVLIVFFVAFYFIRHRREAAAVATAAAAKNTPAKTLGNVNPERRTVQPGSQTLRETVPGNVIVPATSNLPDTDAPVVRATPTPPPVVTRAATTPPPKLPKLIQSYSAQGPAPLSISPPKLFAPTGTLIKCSLVLTVDSSSLQTPVLAEITEDVWENKKLIIPAGTLAYGFAGKGHVRDRIDVSGAWDLIFKDGREYQIRGVALDREKDANGAGFGLTDGSAGIKGQILESDEYGDLKIFLATAIGAVANNSLSTTNQGFGNSVDQQRPKRAVARRASRPGSLRSAHRGKPAGRRDFRARRGGVGVLHLPAQRGGAAVGIGRWPGAGRQAEKLLGLGAGLLRCPASRRRGPPCSHGGRRPAPDDPGRVAAARSRDATGSILPQRQKGKQRRQPCLFLPFQRLSFQ